MRRASTILPQALLVLASAAAAHAQVTMSPSLSRPEVLKERPAATAAPRATAPLAPNAVGAWVQAATLGREEHDAFDEALDLRTRFKSAFQRAIVAKDPAAVAVEMAFLARDRDRFEDAVDSDSFSVPDKQLINNCAQALLASLREALRRTSNPVVTVFADGNIRGVINNGDTADEATSTGSLGVAVGTVDWELSASIAVASTRDETTSGFGSSILTPATGRRLQAGLINARLKSVPGFNRLHLYGSFGQMLWRVSPDPASAPVSATVIGMGALCSWLPVEGHLGENLVEVSLEAGLGYRLLTGDAASRPPFLAVALGGEGRWFVGPEFGFQIAFGRVTAALQYYVLIDARRRSGNDIDGLTGGQLAAGISVAGDIFRDRLGE